MQKIVIKNFMAIQEAEIDIDQMTLLIGEQASGKSTIAKLIYFFKSLGKELLRAIYENLGQEAGEISKEFNKQIKIKFSKFFGSTKHLSGFMIEYKYSDVKYIQLSHYTNGRLKAFISKRLSDSLFGEELFDLLNEIQKYATPKNTYDTLRYDNLIRRIDEFVNKNLGDDYRTPFYIPASRSVTVGYPDQLRLIFDRSLYLQLDKESQSASPTIDLFLMSEFVEGTERVKDQFRNKNFELLIKERYEEKQKTERLPLEQAAALVGKILKGRYQAVQTYERIYFSPDRYVDLNDASSGQQESIRVLQDIFLILLERQPSFRVIEEPEAHLYPMAQKYLLELIALVLNQTDSQAVITTHSPYVLSVFNNLLYATYVANLHASDSTNEVAKSIPKEYWLDATSFRAYALKNGHCQSIIDNGTGMIAQNFLDDISDELGDEFNAMYALHARILRQANGKAQ